MTSKYYRDALQTATLALVVEHELEILSHVPVPFWQLNATFSAGDARWKARWERTGHKDDPDRPEHKAFPSEGGTRVSAFAHLPRHVAAGEILHSTLSVRDVTPTLLDFAGIEHPGNTFEGKEIHPMQGDSFRPLLSNSAIYRCP